MITLYETVIESKKGDKECTMELIRRFDPLIKKYSRKLSYDGSNIDLIISLLETIAYIPIDKHITLREDGCIISYINNSIKHTYINLSKKNSTILKTEKEINNDFLLETYRDCLDDVIYVNSLIDKLSLLQQKVVKEIYFNDKSVESLTKELNVSRQSINRTKNRALKKLRELYSSE